MLNEEVGDTQELHDRLERAKKLQYVKTEKSNAQKLMEHAMKTKAYCPADVPLLQEQNNQKEEAITSDHSLTIAAVTDPLSDPASLYVPTYHYESQVPLYAQAGGGGNNPASAQNSVMQYLNFKEYLQGIYVRGQSRFINVVHSTWHALRVDDNYLLVDINQDDKDDIVMRTNDTVYIKYSDQKDHVGPATGEVYFTTLYEFATIQSIDNLANRTQNTQ